MERLEKYVGDIPPNQLWYKSEPQESTLEDDGVFHVIIYLLKAYIQYVVNMADPPSTAGLVSVPAQVVQQAAASAHSAPAPAGWLQPRSMLRHLHSLCLHWLGRAQCLEQQQDLYSLCLDQLQRLCQSK